LSVARARLLAWAINTAMIGRSGPFWEFLAGRQPAPPAARTLGWELSWVAPDRAEIEVFFDARADFANPMGNVQGGFLAAMLDDTLGHALAATLGEGEFAATLELKVSFLRPATPGRITGTGRVVHRGGSIAFLAGNCGTRPGTCWPSRWPRSGSSARTDTDPAPGNPIVAEAD
jgi:uncharacterized protein (TIGR00369 family)